MTRSACAMVVAGCVVVSGCAGAARTAPYSMGDVETGENSIEAARQQLVGRWTLVALEMAAEDGRRTAVDAAGDLTMDPYGNLDIQYRLTDEGRLTLEKLGITPPGTVISTSGRAVIDPGQHKIAYVAAGTTPLAFDPEVAARRADPFALERDRYYMVAPDGTLTLATRHGGGQDAATSRWRKAGN